MPDGWEYPWFAAWDLAFHMLPMALVDPDFAKDQLLLLTREWYQHPNGQLPAYEWSFSDVNPPVHAWAAWRVYKIDRRMNGKPDRDFLAPDLPEAPAELHLVGQSQGHRGPQRLPGRLPRAGQHRRRSTGPRRSRSPATSARPTARRGWASTRSSMLAIALELARDDSAYEDVATKFFEHFLYIAGALNDIGVESDAAVGSGGRVLLRRAPSRYRRVRPAQGALAGRADPAAGGRDDRARAPRVGSPDFKRRMDWFLHNRPDLAALVSSWEERGVGERRLLALVRGHRMKSLLARMLDPDEFLSDHGIRSLSRDPPGATVHAWSSAARSTGSTTSRPSRGPARSAATPTGAGRSGSRSTTCSSRRSRSSTTTTATTSRCPCPTGGTGWSRSARSPTTSAARLETLFLPDDRGTAAVPRAGRPESAGRLRGRPAAAVPRVLRRRHRPWARGEPPDRLDRARREAPRPARAATARGERRRHGRGRRWRRPGSVALRPSAAARGPAEPAPAPSSRTDRIAIVHDYFTQRVARSAWSAISRGSCRRPRSTPRSTTASGSRTRSARPASGRPRSSGSDGMASR